MGVTKYFRIREDRSIENRPEILGFKSTFTKAEYVTDDDNIIYVKPTKKALEYTDYLAKTLLAVSDEFKEVIKMYHEDNYTYKMVVLQEEGKKSNTSTGP